MHQLLRSALALATLGAAGCYHAVVETGLPAGTTVISQPWTHTFVFGLVPAKEIETASRCPAGVARVDTQQSFVNGLVGAVTLGIYTPQQVTITCAAGGTGALPAGRVLDVGAGATLEAKVDAVREAATRARDAGAPVFVRF